MSLELRSVLLVTPRWTRDGGVATHVIASAEALAAAGVEVDVLAAQVDRSESPAGVTVHPAPQLFDARASAEARLAVARTLRPSVIHLHQFDDPAALRFMRKHAPVVNSAHGYPACTSGVHYFRPGQECARAHGPGCVPNLALRGCAHVRDPRMLPAAYRRASRGVETLRRADLAVSYSSAIDRHLEDNGVTRRAIVPLFATISPASATGHAARRRVVFAGRVITAKGIGVLLRATRDVDAELVVCGDGWQLDAMRRLARRQRMQERVRFTGWLGSGPLARELAEASIVAMPSLWPEPFGLVGIEAHASGRPVVASATGGVGDWLEHGVGGLLVKPGDRAALATALTELLDDPARQRAMGEAGRRNVAARFSRSRHVAALLDAYRTARSSWELGAGRASRAPTGAGAPAEPTRT
ncbi:MAG TPA: glycosyltransferase family 4 protein [Solirubrobacteraceae bacterium]|jgi:glycosyltransferase involved in cell wall biosynthesis|nr:glycosyltransferase family 4 protein [Solirubrobacteraceae bacterium]